MQDKDSEALRNQRRQEKADCKNETYHNRDNCRVDHPVHDSDHFSACPDEIHGEKVR